MLKYLKCHLTCCNLTFKRLISINLASCLVKSTSSDITNPFNDIMVGIVELGFKNFQITNLWEIDNIIIQYFTR